MTREQAIDRLLLLYKAPANPWRGYFNNIIDSIMGRDCEHLTEAMFTELLGQMKKIT